MSNSDAALALGICTRQIIRLKKKFMVAGDAALIHGNRNRMPKHRIGDDIRADVLRLFQEKYYDFNFSHFTDLLNEKEGISVSRASVARILAAAGIVSKKHVRRRPKLHRGRPRKVAAGMLWQTMQLNSSGSVKATGMRRFMPISTTRRISLPVHSSL